MNADRRWLVALVLALTALFVSHNVLTRLAARITDGGEIALFDARQHGYALADAKAIVDSIGADGLGAYIRLWPLLDGAFPLCLLAATAVLMLMLTRSYPSSARGLALLLPLLACIADFRENAAVSAMLIAIRDSGNFDGVATAHTATILKWQAYYCSFASLLLFLLSAVLPAIIVRGSNAQPR